MSELDLLADCLKDATKERDELAAALDQANAREREAFRYGWQLRAGFACGGDQEQAWQQYRKLTETAGDSEPGSTKQRLDMLDQFEEAERIAEHVSNLTKTDGDKSDV